MPNIGKAKVRVKLDAFSKVFERAMLKIGKQIEIARPKTVADLKTYAAETIRSSDVFQGIIGGFPTGDANDLQAHFGLTPARAAAAASEIILHVTNNIDVFVTRRKQKKGEVTIEVRAVGFNPENYQTPLLAIREPFAYRSTIKTKEGKTLVGQVIPWMRWVMSGGRTLAEETNPGISDYYIDFKSPGNTSRSGRALMRRLLQNGKATSDIFPYTMPTILIPKNSNAEQFIDDIFRTLWFRDGVRVRLGYFGRGTFPRKAVVN